MKLWLAALTVAVSTLAAFAGPETILGKVRQRGAEIQTQGNLTQIGAALLMYAADHRDLLPDKPGAAGLAKLRPYGMEPAIFVVEYDRKSRVGTWDSLTEANTSFLYLGNAIGRLRELRSPSSIPLLLEKPSARNGERMNCVFADGHVSGVVLPEGASAADAVRKLRGMAALAAASAQEKAVWDALVQAAADFDAAQSRND